MIKIIVDSEETKKTLLDESRYLHHLRNVDSDKCNTLIHIYANPDIIEVKRKVPEYRPKLGNPSV